VNRSIRLRIALAVFAVVISLVALQNVWVLERFKHGFTEEIDDMLEEDLGEIRLVLGTPALAEWIEESTQRQRRENELFVEVRDADGKVIAHSLNVPDAGFPGARGTIGPPKLYYWEFAHPRSHSGARRVRALEAWVGEYHVAIGISLQETQRWYWGLRKNLATSLLAIAVLGALSAYWVAARSLRPVSRIAAQARALGGLSDGVLPRTGSGDEIDRLAAVLNDLLHRIREEVLRVRRLTADAAHALRTPLTAIRGHLELDAAGAAGGASDPVATAIEQVDDLIRFVNRLLLLEKLESGLGEPSSRERFDLLQLARELVDHLRVIAEEREISLECRGESAWVEADAVWIRQAIVNLLDNALRHTPVGGKVAVDVGTLGGAAEISIWDSGKGLLPDQLERVFERYYSTRGGTGAGTGLGLPIARAIARTYGGDVTATSPGGARFVLRLPVASEAPA
jgi:signal transduction histidine kinase